jgi:hypothetical protein
MNVAQGSFADSEKVAHGTFVDFEKCTFHLTTFVLRGAWPNRHNSRQGRNLDKLINQSEPTRDLALA